MSPLPSLTMETLEKRGEVVPKPLGNALIVEAWAQGYLVGSLIIMAFITMANMRRGALLHKLILLELIMGIWQGFWLFFPSPVYAWWLSVGAIFLNASWSLHNVIAWMKLKPFLSKPVSYIYIGTVILVQPYWVVEIYANFAYFHGVNNLFLKTRPYEALCRDPWWIYTTVMLFWIIKTQYDLTLREILRISPRFGIMLGAMILSITFIILDILTVTDVLNLGGTVGINPFWKLAFVFKCLTDSVILDDFKTALDRLKAFKFSRLGSFSQDMSDRRTQNDGGLVNTWEEMEKESKGRKRPTPVPSPDGDIDHPSYFPKFNLHRKAKDRKDSGSDLKGHKDSVVGPSGIVITRDFSTYSNNIAPEDMVPSALRDPPMRTLEHAHVRKASSSMDSRRWGSLDGRMADENEYAQALRDVERTNAPDSSSRSNHSYRRNS